MEGLYCLQNILISHTIEETLMVRDTVIFLLQQIGFVLNLKKSLLTPTQRIDFLGVTVDSLIMTLSLPEKKVSKAQKKFLKLVQKTQVWILELAKLIGLLPSTIQAALPAQINFRYLQQQQIQALKTQGSYCKKVILNRTGVVDTKFENLQWSLLDSVAQPSADTDRYIQEGMGCSMSGDINRGAMVKGGTVIRHKCV